MKSKNLTMFSATSAGLFVLISLTAVGHGADQSWNPAGPTNNWSTLAGDENWDAGVVWTPGNNAIFGTTGEAVTLTEGISVGNITFGASGYSIADNTLTLGASVIDTGAFNAGISSQLSGASLTKSGSGTLTLSNTSNNYTGATTINGGAISISSAGNLPSASALSLANGGTLLVNSSNTAVANALTIASGDSGVIKGGSGINQQVSGSLSGVAGNLILDISNLSGGGLNMTGTAMGATASGSVVTLANAGNGNAAYLFFNSASAYSVFANSKLTVNSTGTGTDTLFFLVGGGTVQLGALDGGDSGSSTLNNGTGPTLQINGTTDGSYAGNIGNGTITALTKNGASTQEFSGTGIAYTGATTLNGGILKLTKTTGWASNIAMHASNAVTLQLNSSLLADSWTFNKQITGGSTAAKIEKTGLGTVILSPAASSSFVGNATEAVRVSEGKLYVNSANFTTPPVVSMASGATTLGGTGTVGNVEVTSGGTLEGGYGGSGTLTAANVTTAGTVTLKGTLATGGYKALSVTNLAINGGDESVLIDATGLSLTNGTYDLLESSNAITQTGASSVLATLKTNSRSYTPALSGDSKKIQVIYDTNASIYWTGVASASWNTTDTNWKLSVTGNPDTEFRANDVVFFHDTVNAIEWVDLLDADVNPISTTFDNTTASDYYLGGDFGIVAGSIIKNGNGTVYFENTNNTAGAVFLNGGRADLSQTGGLGTGPLTFGGGALTYSGSNTSWSRSVTLDVTGLIAVNGSATLTLSGVIGGAAGLSVSGTGTLVISGTSNNYGGATTVNGGTASIDNSANLPAASVVTLANSGTLLVNNSNMFFGNNITIANGDSGVIKGGTGINQQVTGNLSGVAGNLILDVSNASGGGLQLNGGAMGVTAVGSVVTMRSNGNADSYVFLNSASGRAVLGNSSVVMSKTGGGSLNLYMGGGGTVELGALAGGNTSCTIGNHFGGSGTLQINGTADGSYSGNIGTIVSFLTKNGSGTQEFTGSGITYTGATTINGGTLKLTDTTAWASDIGFATSGTPKLQLDGSWSLGKVISGANAAANVEKTGGGTVALTAENTYTGTTTVTAGTLAANNTTGSATGTGTVTVKPAATLAGTGTLSGATTIEANGFVAPGNGGTGKLTLASATLSGIYQCQIDGASYDRVDVTGALTVTGGAIAITTLNSPTENEYTIATYGPGSSGMPSVSGPLPSGYTLDTATTGVIKLVKILAGYDNWALGITDSNKRLRTDDADGDGFTNLQEFLFGTDPNTGHDPLTTTETIGGNLVIHWKERTGCTYFLMESATLENSWTNSTATIESDGPQAGDYLPKKAQVPLGPDKNFYRIEGVEN